MIYFAFFAANVVSIRISRKQYKLEGWNLLKKIEKLMTLENIFKKMQNFWRCLVVTQGRIILELSVFQLP